MMNNSRKQVAALAPLTVVAGTICALSGIATGAPLTGGNLVVMFVSSNHPGGAGSIRLEEFTAAGTANGNAIDLPSTGPGAVSISDQSGHDRHIHRSSDGRFLTFVCYGGAAGTDDWAGFGASDAPRTVAIVSADGSIDTTTRLTDAFDYTAVRGVFTTDGTKIWVAGDNASGAIVSGGLRYTTRGSSSDVNLSQVQSIGGINTPDNVRDVMVFDGQLYDCSGSNASIGKGVFVVGSGLPTSGSQTLTGPLNGNDNSSVSGFSMLDLNPAIAGVDVLYSATSAGLVGIRKYVKIADGTWQPRGYVAFTGIDHVVAVAETDGTVTLYGGGIAGLAKFRDTAPLTGTLTGALTAYLIAPPAGYTMGGFDFAPTASTAPACIADINRDGVVDGDDFVAFINSFGIGDVSIDPAADVVPDSIIDGNDFITFINAFAAGC